MRLLKLVSCSLLLGLTLKANAYYTQQGQIYDQQGKKVAINGVSWSGFQDTNVFQGLQNNAFYSIKNQPGYSHSYGLMDLLTHAGDFADSGVDKQSAVQFKTVRLPIQPGVLYDATNEVDLNKAISDKDNPRFGNGIFCQSWQSNGKACQKAVNSKQAFWTVLAEMKKQHVRVMIDFHHRNGYGDGMRDGTVYDMNQYAKDITLLATEIKKRNLDNVIGIDIFNEPYKLSWFKGRNSQVAWAKVLATAAKATHQANPDLLLFVEGSGGGNDDLDNPVICVAKNDIQDDQGYAHWSDSSKCGVGQDVVDFKGNWGEDFKPLLNTQMAKQGVASLDINKLTSQMQQQVPALDSAAIDWLLGDDKAGNKGHLVFSPHVYPKEVAGWETAPGNPSNLRFDWSWGFLHKAGFPVVLGEASWKSVSGKSFFTQALMPYLSQNGIGTNNVYFWGIGFLGDTVSVIDPNTGKLELDVQKTLKQYFS